jgi:hypothetical protein
MLVTPNKSGLSSVKMEQKFVNEVSNLSITESEIDISQHIVQSNEHINHNLRIEPRARAYLVPNEKSIKFISRVQAQNKPPQNSMVSNNHGCEEAEESWDFDSLEVIKGKSLHYFRLNETSEFANDWVHPILPKRSEKIKEH